MKQPKVYDLQVKGYHATGRVDIDDARLEIDVEFSVSNASGDLYIEIDSIDAWGQFNDTFPIDDRVDLDDLADQIISLGDINDWEADEIGSKIDSAMDSLEDR